MCVSLTLKSIFCGLQIIRTIWKYDADAKPATLNIECCDADYRPADIILHCNADVRRQPD